MTTTIPNVSIYEQARYNFRKNFNEGIRPADSRQPIADELAKQMVQELIDSGVDKTASIGVIDAFLILSTHLKEAGFVNLTVLENSYQNLTEQQQKYYNNIQVICKQSNIEYYVPPMNNWQRSEKQFDVVIGNPPYQGNLAQKLWHKFLEMSIHNASVVSLILPTSVSSPGKSWELIRNNLVKIDFNVAQHFKGVGSTFCRIFIDTTKVVDNTEIVTENDGTFNIDIRGYNFLPPVINEETLSLYKLLTGEREWIRSTEYHTTRRNDWSDPNGSIEVLHTNAQTILTNQSHPNNDKIRVAISLSGYPNFKVLHNQGASETCVWTECDTLEQANELCDYYNSPLIQKLVKTYKWSGFNSRLVIMLLGNP